jgi:hypothetical protein
LLSHLGFLLLLPAYHAVSDEQLTAEQEAQLEALGRCWAKAMLEGIHISMELCPIVFR